MQGPPPATVHQRDGDQGHDHHDYADPDGRKFGTWVTQTGRDEQVGWVVEYLEE